MNTFQKLKAQYQYLFLFLLTFLTTTFAGVEWTSLKTIYSESLTFKEILRGLTFSVAFLAILSAHEFSHYFTAKYHKLKVSLPKYIPFWLFGLIPSIGTFGAFIRIKDKIETRKEYFDVGVSGPLGGFLLIIPILMVAFTTLPPVEYIFSIHPEYAQYGKNYAEHVYSDIPDGLNFTMGTNLFFELAKEWFVSDPSLIPNSHEIFHYPLLLATFLACFFTALNLLPIGQLDGGHITYALLGEKVHKYVALSFYLLLLYFGGLGVFQDYESVSSFGIPSIIYLIFIFFLLEKSFQNKLKPLLLSLIIVTIQYFTYYNFKNVQGFTGWLAFAFIIGRFIGIFHPPATINTKLDTKRKLVGVLALIVFILCFSPTPFQAQ